MEVTIFLFGVISFIVFLIFLQPIIGYIRTKRIGASIPFVSCIFMSIRKTLNKELIQAVALSQNKSLCIGIDVLEAHMLASGSPLKCMEALDYARSKKLDVDFSLIAAADLADKDIWDAINKTGENMKLQVKESNIRDSKLKTIDFEYIGNLKLTFGRVCFSPPNNDKLEDEIASKVRKFIEYSDSSDKYATSKIINETILDTSFWESKGLKLVSQDIKINNT